MDFADQFISTDGRTYGSRNSPEFWTTRITNELDSYSNNFGPEKGLKLILRKISNLDFTEETDAIAKLVYAYYEKDLKNHASVVTYEQAVCKGKKIGR